MSKRKLPIPTTPAECVSEGYEKRRDAIGKMNDWTRATEQQHRIVKLSDGKWYVYNGVYPECRHFP
jgi:hypothetical protein